MLVGEDLLLILYMSMLCSINIPRMKKVTHLVQYFNTIKLQFVPDTSFSYPMKMNNLKLGKALKMGENGELNNVHQKIFLKMNKTYENLI